MNRDLRDWNIFVFFSHPNWSHDLSVDVLSLSLEEIVLSLHQVQLFCCWLCLIAEFTVRTFRLSRVFLPRGIESDDSRSNLDILFWSLFFSGLIIFCLPSQKEIIAPITNWSLYVWAKTESCLWALTIYFTFNVHLLFCRLREKKEREQLKHGLSDTMNGF